MCRGRLVSTAAPRAFRAARLELRRVARAAARVAFVAGVLPRLGLLVEPHVDAVRGGLGREDAV